MDFGDDKIVIGDRACTLSIDDGGARYIGDVDRVGFTRLNGNVAIDRHIKAVAVTAGCNGLSGQ